MPCSTALADDALSEVHTKNIKVDSPGVEMSMLEAEAGRRLCERAVQRLLYYTTPP